LICNSEPNSKLFAIALQIVLVSVINYNDVISTTNWLEFITDALFTDVKIVGNIIV